MLVRSSPVLVFLLAAALSGAPVHAQRSPATTRAVAGYVRVPYVLLPDSVRNWFASRWDDTSRVQKESGGCLTYRREVTRLGDTLYWVTSATLVTPEYDSQRGIEFTCPHHAARWHSHTPTTCRSDTWGNVNYASCVLGGVDAYSCQPSGDDRVRLRAVGAPFGLIHCDRRALVPYFPARRSP
ncbi:MAG TPA: hypothetical protein VFW98_12030 [Gemmatimonadaceae bacterium]|nr:hypothetical protein [Gemmatimonadaceae bacterium]